jgi:hypothetical protein
VDRYQRTFCRQKFDEGLLVRDELVQDVIGDIGLSCVNAIAYLRGVVIAIMENTC